MYFRNGYLIIKLSGAAPAILVHWTAPLLAVIVGGFGFRPGAWLGVFAIILIHELGHAFAVLKVRATVVAIRMDATGGDCEWAGRVTRAQRLAIVWGGALAQLLLWAITLVAFSYLGPPAGAFAGDLVLTLLEWNLVIAAFNLLPVKPLDGYEAWRLLRPAWQDWRWRRRSARRRRLMAKGLKKTKEIERLDPNVAPRPETREMINQIIRRVAEEHRAKNQTAENEEK